MLPAEVIRAKREGAALSEAQIDAFVRGLVDRRWSDAQVGALAMAICLRGMTRDETVLLTRAMTHSGAVLDWSRANLAGPVLDKHSTGGVGDKVSLVLAPIVAACGAVVPMLSGRGLGHTGGTLDKLESLPGYTVTPPRSTLLRVLRDAGCAIVGASARIAPADRRLYAIRDVTSTVESLPLITASILSKKLAAGLHGLVMDVKVGNGAFCAELDAARALAGTLVEVAQAAGLRTRALITDMNQVLGSTAGNALEVQEAIDFLTGAQREPRLCDVTLALAAEMLQLGGLATTLEAGRQLAREALDSGRAAERFETMVAGLGGPSTVLLRGVAKLPRARWRIPVPAPEAGVLVAMDTRAIGLAIVALGGGRARPGDAIDPRVGLSDVRSLGSRVHAGEPLAMLHATQLADGKAAARSLVRAFRIGGRAPQHDAPVVVE
jgi:thymidine phosphorylase